LESSNHYYPNASIDIPLLLFPMQRDLEDQYIEDLFNKEEEMGIDALISIERLGKSTSGRYYTMRARDISEYTARIDRMFDYALTHQEKEILTIGIGDGGNEIGMGNIIEKVKQNIPNGETIGCLTTVDHLLVCGVSNWGGYAIAQGLYLFHKYKTGESKSDMLPSVENEEKIIKEMEDNGAVDGVTLSKGLKIDGIELKIHMDLLEKMNHIAQD